MTELIGEAAEMDKAFWDNPVWAEGDDSENESFDENEEEVKPDVFDSDFNDTETEESDEDEEGQLKAQQRRERSSAAKSGGGGVHKEPVKPSRPRAAASSGTPASKPKPKPVDNTPQELSITLRQSTQSKSTARAKEELAVKALARPKVVRPPIPKKEYSQRDLLLEALETEVTNFKWLKSQQMAEDERNRLESKIAKPTKKIARTLLSSQKASTITFVDDSAWPSIFNSTLHTYPDRRSDGYDSDIDDLESRRKQASLVCAVTGLPARYRDPLTGLPYFDADAFKQLREAHYAQQARDTAGRKSKDRAPPVRRSRSQSGFVVATISNSRSVSSYSDGTYIEDRASVSAGDISQKSQKIQKKRGRKPKVQPTKLPAPEESVHEGLPAGANEMEKCWDSN
eukprot:CAMPEP_0114463670 /NCGR_PEP_ID=MMETSP0104-20121206/7490_1 /TAXON_ID=37642 ORGANISM="Paraphysomonas imperforata, Strain PA2" /NCGR_SAMPLE_ID=MMETSP0104 /ASSEMBLY_ACC=CAM_ASM_000202 /LENGTH=398 /DNA_ID=CAMNT_0001636639 /DNA_START=137 /DNA_END=1330 /DNA_ORIENTATION=-